MKLASIANDCRDGRLAIVSADLTRMVLADAAPSLLEAMDHWSAVLPLLSRQAQRLADGSEVRATAFDPQSVCAPLPRSPQWLDASAFRTHSELVAAAWSNRNRWSDDRPLMYQGASDDFRPWNGPSYLPDEAHDMDLEAEIAVVVDDVPMGVGPQDALQHIKLVTLVDDVSLRAFGAPEQDAGFGFIRAKPSTVFAPVVVTPDELGSHWQGGRLHLPVEVQVNGKRIGAPDARHMSFHFGQLIAHAATTRKLSAGTIIGSGTVSDPDRQAGSATLLEVRAIEQIAHGAPRTPFLRFGDRVMIEVREPSGRSPFGAIDHPVLKAEAHG